MAGKAATKNYWLMKSEPDTYSIDDLKKDGKGLWDGVRNYQARNFMMNDMALGDEVLFYHSNAKPPGVAGTAKVSARAIPDITAQDPKSKYYDAKASPEKPIWHCVEIQYKKKFKKVISLDELREQKSLKDMLLLKKGQRLSIMPVSKKEFDFVCKIATS